MLSKEEIEKAKEDFKFFNEGDYITKEMSDSKNILFEYIWQLETKIKELGKGQQSLMQSRRKWKNRYYKMRKKNKELQKSVEQIYDDYQDIGKMYFDLDEKRQKLIEKLEEDNEKDKHTVQVYEEMYRNATEEFYKRSYKRTIDMANASRETRKGVLSILKGKNQVTVK